MGKIKSIRQKGSNDNTFSDPIPFGADGINIDMTSGLNLEEQFKLGGLENHQLSETDSGTTISSTYKNNAGSIINIMEYLIIEDDNGTTITASLKNSSGSSVIRTKQFTIAPPSSDGTIAISSTWIPVNNETQGGGQ